MSTRLDFGQRLSGYAPCAGLRAADPAQLHTLQGDTMGTRWQLRLANPAMRPLAEVRAIVQAQLDLVIAQMSHWEPQSLISRFNAAGAGTRFALPREFAQVLAAGLHWARASGGAFDPAAGRLVAAWGFGPHAASQLPPSPAQLLALPGSSWRDLTLAEAAAEGLPDALAQGWVDAPIDAPLTDSINAPVAPVAPVAGLVQPPIAHQPSPSPRSLTQPGGLWLDFSGIAKGFAVDAVSQALQAAGLADHLIDIGGELRASGRRPDGQPWRVRLDAAEPDSASQPSPGHQPNPHGPRTPSNPPSPVLALRDVAIATSGSRWHHHQRGEQAWNHTVDPRTGLASMSPLRAVSVLHTSCMQADALATTLWVLGPTAGLAFAQAHGVAARLRGVNGEIHATAPWKRAVGP